MFFWRHAFFDLGELGHESIVDREATGCVVDNRVTLQLASVRPGFVADVRGLAARNGEHRDAELFAKNLELLDRTRSLHICRNEQRLSIELTLEQRGELGRRRRLAGALQTYHDNAGWLRLRGEGDVLAFRGHHLLKLVLAGFDEALGRTDAHGALADLGLALHRLADDLFFHAREEALHHAELDVRFQERDAYVPQRLVDVFFGELGNASESISRCAEALGQRLEHGITRDGRAYHAPSGGTRECCRPRSA